MKKQVEVKFTREEADALIVFFRAYIRGISADELQEMIEDDFFPIEAALEGKDAIRYAEFELLARRAVKP